MIITQPDVKLDLLSFHGVFIQNQFSLNLHFIFLIISSRISIDKHRYNLTESKTSCKPVILAFEIHVHYIKMPLG